MKTYNTDSKYKHVEAFCVMTYRCECCNFEERIWNSRDGVTPFVIGCPSCGKPNHKHVDWQNDVRSPLHSMTMKPGDRYFTDLTMMRARAIAAIRVDRSIEEGKISPNARNRVIETVALSYFGSGSNPDIAIKNES